MKLLLYIFVNVLIVGLFLYSKLTPYKDRLTGTYNSWFRFFDAIFNPILSLFRPIFRPLQVGSGIAVDVAQVILLIIMLVVLKLV